MTVQDFYRLRLFLFFLIYFQKSIVLFLLKIVLTRLGLIEEMLLSRF